MAEKTLIPPQTVDVVVAETVQASPDIWLLRLKKKDNSPFFDFISGQFVMVSLVKDGKEVRRAFSIASSPLDRLVMELCVKRYEEGSLSPLLTALSERAALQVMGPYGKFLLDTETTDDYLFVAAGSGIAPIMGMIRTLAELKKKNDVVLVYGFRHPDDYVYRKELEAIQKKSSNLTTLPCSSVGGASWAGHVGHVTDVLGGSLANKDKTKTSVYICGPPAMVDDSARKLVALGLPPAKMHTEKYN